MKQLRVLYDVLSQGLDRLILESQAIMLPFPVAKRQVDHPHDCCIPIRKSRKEFRYVQF